MMVMETLRRTAPKYGLHCLLHEKPFAGVNGSGKHLNWSMGDDLGNNLLQPGDNPHDNVQFLVFCAAVLRAVHKSQGLLRAAIASAGNDHRLGANEAPPAIISVFLGDMLTDIFEQIEKGAAKSTKSGGILETGVSVLPKLPRDAGDRNRTSPFAFTGNKFEFRAVSSGQSIAMPNICLNVAVADSLAYVADELEKATAGGQSLDAAVGKLLTKMIKESKPIIFNGNNYSAEWEKEAAKRKLLNLKNTVDALPELVTPQAIKVFETHKVLNAREVHARHEIMLEQYVKTINVEAQLMVLMANRYILPAAVSYQTALAQSVAAGKAAGVPRGGDEEAPRPGSPRPSTASARAPTSSRRRPTTPAARPRSTPSTCATRSSRRWPRCASWATSIETTVPSNAWPLPTYREMLFIK